MRIILAPDSFKGTLTSAEVCAIVADALRERVPQAECVSIPMADGGEGTLAAVCAAVPGCRRIPVPAHDPLGRPVPAEYALLPDGQTALVELAVASGLGLLAPAERNPLAATTYGTGETIAAALQAGCTRLVVGLGGSATVDGGAGIAAALGAVFRGTDGTAALPRPDSLDRLVAVEWDRARWAHIEVTIASDVTNPLLGPDGAAAVFGPQKGATPEMVRTLEHSLAAWAALWHDDGTRPGDGAAGGAGFILRQLFPQCCTESGARLVGKLAGLEEAIANADLVITGEGASDQQTLHGKLPWIVAECARRHRVPVTLLSGYVSRSARPALADAFDQLVSTVDAPLPEAQLTRAVAADNLRRAAAHIQLP